MKKDSKPENHPSYGMVQISRVSAGGPGANLFGSAMQHGHFFALRISEGERDHNLGSDRYRSTSRLPYVEVLLSPSQFVSMITTMNIGDGVPCTINRIGAESIEDCPSQVTEGERVRTEFKEKIKARGAELKKAMTDADAILNKKTLNKNDRKALHEILWRAERLFSDVAPFAADQFDKATDKLTAQAKAEVEDFIMTAVRRAGFKALTDGESDGIELLQLPESKKDTLDNGGDQ